MGYGIPTIALATLKGERMLKYIAVAIATIIFCVAMFGCFESKRYYTTNIHEECNKCCIVNKRGKKAHCFYESNGVGKCWHCLEK